MEIAPSIIIAILMEIAPAIKVPDVAHAIVHPVTQPVIPVHPANPGQLIPFLTTQSIALIATRSAVAPIGILAARDDAVCQSDLILQAKWIDDQTGGENENKKCQSSEKVPDLAILHVTSLLLKRPPPYFGFSPLQLDERSLPTSIADPVPAAKPKAWLSINSASASDFQFKARRAITSSVNKTPGYS